MSKTIILIFLFTFFTSALISQDEFPAYGIEIAAGKGFFSNKELNDFLQQLERDKISNGLSVRIAINFTVSPHLNLFGGVGYVSGNSKAQNIVTGANSPDPVATVEDEYKISSIPLSIGGVYRHRISSIFLRIRGGIEYHFIGITYKFPAVSEVNLPEYTNKKTGNGVGILLGTGVIWPVHS